MMRKRISLFLLFTLGGCNFASTLGVTPPTLPKTFHEEVPASDQVANVPWWDVYQDPQLSSLIPTSLTENRDMARAVARLSEATAAVTFIRANQFPILGVRGGAERLDSAVVTAPTNSFSLLGTLNFEVDLWGKLSNATAAERAALLASEFGVRTVSISLVAQTAELYLTLVDLENRYAIADRTEKNRHDATELMRTRFSQGIIPKLDVNQAEIEEATAAATRVQLEREIRLTENALAVVLGGTPRTYLRRQRLQEFPPLTKVPTIVPATLLERRPDILAAEFSVKEAYARVAVAKAQRLPSLSLLGTLGLGSNDIDNFIEGDSRTWSIGGGLLGPLLSYNQNIARVEIAEARVAQALASHEQQVLLAIREVEDSLVGIRTLQAEHKIRSLQVNASKNYYRLARARYDDGITHYIEVLDSQRSLLNAELSESLTYRQYLTSHVQLFRALGGGWYAEKR